MKISTREVVLLTALFLLLLSGAYYLFFYMPTSNEINELQENITSKTTQIDNASITLLRKQALTLNKGAIEEDFVHIEKLLHEDFSDADILRRIEKIIKPYTNVMNIEFANRNTGPNEEVRLTSVRTVQVSLNTSFKNLQGIIKAFENEDIANRIINFTCGTVYNEFPGTADKELRVNISVDFLER